MTTGGGTVLGIAVVQSHGVTVWPSLCQTITKSKRRVEGLLRSAVALLFLIQIVNSMKNCSAVVSKSVKVIFKCWCVSVTISVNWILK